MTRKSGQSVSIEADLKLERFDQSHVVQVVEMFTTDGDTILIESSGSLPRVSLKNARTSKFGLVAIADATRQNIIVKHNDHVITRVSNAGNLPAKLSIHWWNLFKQYILKRT